MYRTALAGAYPSRSRSSANASICGPLIPPRKRLNDLGAEKNFSNMESPCWVLAIDGQHQRSKRPKFNGESRPPPKPVPKPAQRQSWLPHSPLEKTPHNARSRSGVGDFVQYLAQGDPCGSSAAWKKKDLSNDAIASTKSERSIADIQAPLGRATTRSLERVAASVGMLNGAPIEFELVKDVPDGGVLFALPALLLLGLLSKSREMFSMPEGFYPLESIFLLLALMALARIPSLEALRYVAPGEWGKLMGLDRIPEVRTLRQKITQLCSEQGLAERWSNALAKQWMAQEPECAGVFYADGHVRVYHGKLTDLPRRYIARERLCLRGTTDYWVNAMDGRPFFVVSCAVDPGLLSVLREQIVPRLK